MNATILTFHHGTHTQREVLLSKLHTKHGTIAYVTIDANGNSKALFRRPTAWYLVATETTEIPELDMFLHITNLIEHWQELTRQRIEDSVSYGIGHDGMDSVYHGESEVVLASERDTEIIQRLARRQADLARIIRDKVNRQEKVSV